MDLFLHYLLNIFIILTPIFLYIIFWKDEQTYCQKKIPQLLFFTLCAVTMIIVMLFPIPLHSGITFDLRYIPIFIGTLYGGVPIGIGLIVVHLIGRIILFGYAYLLIGFLISIFLVISASWASKYFNDWSNKKKYGITIIIFFLPSQLLIVYPNNYLSIPRLEAFITMILFLAFTTCIVLIVVFLIDRIQINSRLKQDLIKSEQLRIVSELAASVAHEVRNPMTVARGFIQLIHTNSKLSANEKDYLQLTISELDRAQSIISDYLSLAKPEKKEIKPIQVYHIMDKVRHTIQAYALMNNVSVEMNIPKLVAIYGNEKELTQVMLNLAKNGIEAMEHGGTLTLSANKKDKKVQLVVKDTGIGISKDQLAKVGTAYYSTKEKGTGLGLMISFNIIHSLGGTVSVNSVLGEGTEFKINLPCIQETLL
ncbi:ATP-binding protein [Evansella sp. AB-P1]|uniref:ATP-binding protein n=1 Tax=Evansella sp. AB-P1 TaxID=3037653 RepID=UPI00241E8431|nr:ATP-binding protein [Evansella sp. AB-P1]MDG5786813.1 ATP-binding protein [Evansella sp. AB-P1]